MYYFSWKKYEKSKIIRKYEKKLVETAKAVSP